MYRKKLQRRKKIIITSIIIGVVLLFILVNLLLPDVFKTVGRVSRDGVLYVTSLVTKPFTNLTKSNISTDEYNSLTEQLNDYEEIKNENDELKKEIGSLKEQNKIDTTLSDKVSINSTVINRNLDYWYNSLTIDKGLNDGVTKNMAVLYKGIMVGKITEVTYTSSTVRLLTSSENINKLSVKITVNNKDIYGLLVGYKDGLYTVEGITDNTDIPASSVVTTTGLSDYIPAGLKIGVVDSVTTDNYDLAHIVSVKPDIDMSGIDYVTVVGKK